MMAEHYGICVVLHTDHADRKLVPWVEELLAQGQQFYEMTGKPLYSSHMIDLSVEEIDYNLSECARLLEIAKEIEMSIEIELGCTGGEEDGVGSDEIDNDKLYTQPEDCLKAFELLAPIGHFSLAASFGNVHGVYKPGNVKLRPEILKNSQDLLEKTHRLDKNPYDFVFHGGSGSDKAQIEEALGYGVFKMNIDTDTQFAFAKGVGEYVFENEKAFKHQIDPDDGTPYKKQYDPRAWLRKGEEAMIARLDEAFKDLKSVGKTLAFSDKSD
jgi:fructose-bisphosphate aldolase class II